MPIGPASGAGDRFGIGPATYGVGTSPFGVEETPYGVRGAPGNSSGEGPCLYFGPRGQRCSRPAVQNCFCAQHQPGSLQAVARNLPRIVATVIAILIAIWPVIADFLRIIFRWMESH
jgi:hypothetical protein